MTIILRFPILGVSFEQSVKKRQAVIAAARLDETIIIEPTADGSSVALTGNDQGTLHQIAAIAAA